MPEPRPRRSLRRLNATTSRGKQRVMRRVQRRHEEQLEAGWRFLPREIKCYKTGDGSWRAAGLRVNNLTGFAGGIFAGFVSHNFSVWSVVAEPSSGVVAFGKSD
ncbi:hypothetical protein E2C01_035400 [Portunus trituberculatus]|uniref:Uncharacterized protein n=1 Tax=Portunus trituberculatus TaxID=210409 RepID=A0A5B7F888_PORTR|nr:hypothetical protein [Portunus trituberculatus]